MAYKKVIANISYTEIPDEEFIKCISDYFYIESNLIYNYLVSQPSELI